MILGRQKNKIRSRAPGTEGCCLISGDLLSATASSCEPEARGECPRNRRANALLHGWRPHCGGGRRDWRWPDGGAGKLRGPCVRSVSACRRPGSSGRVHAPGKIRNRSAEDARWRGDAYHGGREGAARGARMWGREGRGGGREEMSRTRKTMMTGSRPTRTLRAVPRAVPSAGRSSPSYLFHLGVIIA